MVHNKIRTKKTPKRRLLVLGIILSSFFILLVGRLGFLMIERGKELKSMAVQQQLNKISIPSKRGKILDRNGVELAINSNVFRVDIDLNVVLRLVKANKLTLQQIQQGIATTLNLDINSVAKKFQITDSKGNPASFVNLVTQAEAGQADAIKNLTINGVKLNGIIITQNTKRLYPDNNLFSQVIGHVNGSGEGIVGVEASYNTHLYGVPGVKTVEADKNQNELPYTETQVTDPIDGKDIILTLDERIQNIAATTAEQALKDNGAKSVSITVMDPNTGEVLAMVNKPDYNPNTPNKGGSSEQVQESWKNRAVENIFEPGSIFKVMTASAGLQEVSGAANMTFNSTGSIKVANRILYNDKQEANGILDMAGIMKYSDNVGFIQLGQKIGKDKFFDFISNVGFGKKTGVDLPGESSGIMRQLKDIGPVELATMSYGQGVAVTQIQYIAAFNAVANGGTWIKPHVMKALVTTDKDNNNKTENYDKFDKKEVLTKENSTLLKTYLEKVVNEGTAVGAKMADIPMAGKTGTARKVNTENGGYLDGKYVSSFTAMAPINDPVVTFIITIDEPDSSKYYAGETAVPAAKNLVTDLASYLHLQTEIKK